MPNPRSAVLRMFGPVGREVALFLRTVSVRANPAIAWEPVPEVHVKCPTPGIALAVLDRYGDQVYSVTDQSFPAVVGGALAAGGLTLATAESCTGGLIGHLVTSVAGSSSYYLGGYISYANEAKARDLGVPPDLLEAHGAVSREVVLAMAQGARRATGADLAVAVSGIAGPGGGSDAKPVGTVWMSLAWEGGADARRHRFEGSRDQVKTLAAYHALDFVRRHAAGLPGPGGERE